MENQIITRNILACSEIQKNILEMTEFNYIKSNFCGLIVFDIKNINNLDNKILYLCGNIENFKLDYDNYNIFIVKEFSYNYGENTQLISSYELPININNVGILFRNFFNNDTNYFQNINEEHTFQTLRESNKPDVAFRTGIYLSKVKKIDQDYQFNILRCSTNLNGPTDNFRETDNMIVYKLNNISKYFFTKNTKFNHVLAQIYENKILFSNKLERHIERKAKIKSHSDKTKDMDPNGLIAFCTFYDGFLDGFKNNKYKKSKIDLCDYIYKGKTSVLTTLHFKLKESAKIKINNDLVSEFSIKLYPNSVFIIPLYTNRLYTHEICPPLLPVGKFPTRMGYVVRCSKTKAVFKNESEKVLIKDTKSKTLIPLTPIKDDDRKLLKALYMQENVSSEFVDYKDFYFSMNDGDYNKPIF